MHARGTSVDSCDPMYRFSPDEMVERIDRTYAVVPEKTRQSRDNFLWDDLESPDRLGAIRMAAMKQFLADVPAGIAERRYRAAELPSLPFPDREFDLALCSHFLFTYSHLLTVEFHVEAVQELCRVAQEARIFPLLPNFGDARSLHVDGTLKALDAEGYSCETKRVRYEFQKGGNEMLASSRQSEGPNHPNAQEAQALRFMAAKGTAARSRKELRKKARRSRCTPG
jgi:hypothetical protein